MLWFNCEFRIETGNEKHKTKHPADSRFQLTISKQNTMYVLFLNGGKGTNVKH